MNRTRGLSKRDQKIVNLFRKHKPTCVRDIFFLKEGSLRYIDQGVSRQAFRVGYSLVLKEERDDSGEPFQNTSEIKILKAINTNRKYQVLRKHVVPIYYHRKRLILAKYAPYKTNWSEQFDELDKKFEKYGINSGGDTGTLNVRKFKKNGPLVFVDLGCGEINR